MIEKHSPEYFGNKAKENFKAGYNCAQALVSAFADEEFFVKSGLTERSAVIALSGFGGGMGKLREVCGAVSGMFFVANLITGYYPEDDKKAWGQLKQKNYEVIQKLAKDFSDQNGSIICRELLGLTKKLDSKEIPQGSLAGSEAPHPEARTESYYKKRPCAELCQMAAEILARELL